MEHSALLKHRWIGESVRVTVSSISAQLLRSKILLRSLQTSTLVVIVLPDIKGSV
jgi:hypothetical protein